METQKINSNFDIIIVIEKVSDFLENLKKVYVFDYINIRFQTQSDFTIEYILKGEKQTDFVDIWILEKKSERVVIVQGEKDLPLEYFVMELKKVL